MAYNTNPNRLSTMSSLSASPRPGGNPQSAQVSTQTLLNALHTSFASAQPNPLEFSTSLVVNTWLTAQNMAQDGRTGGTVDLELAERVWQHARRRAEDASVVLGSLHNSTPSMIAPFIAAFPFQAPTSLYTSLEIIRAFTHCATPFNPSYARYSSLAAEFTLDIEGTLVGTSISLSEGGLDTSLGLLQVPPESGYRAFNVFYYLTAGSSTKAEKDFLDLGPLSSYALLKKSGTFGPPEYVPTADDAAAAEDFRNHLRFIGIKANDLRNLICALAGLLKLGNSLDYFVDGEIVDEVCKSSATLLDMEESTLKNKFDTVEREIFIGGVYEAIVDWVIRYANHAMTQELQASRAAANGASGSATPDEVGDTVTITVIDIPDPTLGKAIALRTVFDDTQGINAEMKEDGVQVDPAGASVLNEMKAALTAKGPELGDMDSVAAREREVLRDRREGVLEKAAQLSSATSYMKELLHPVSGQGVVLGSAGRFDVSSKLLSSRAWFQLNLHPTDDLPSTLATSSNHWSAAAVSSQLRAWRLPEWANRRNKKLDFTTDFDFTEFSFRYAVLGCGEGKEAIETWLVERGWCNGDVVIGHDRIWLRESAWWEAECLKDALPESGMLDATTPGMESGYSAQTPGMGSGFFDNSIPGSRDNLIPGQQSASALSLGFNNLRPHSVAPTGLSTSPGDYGLGKKGDTYRDDLAYEGQGDLENSDGKVVERRPVNYVRRLWLGFVWALTFWIPSPLLRYIGRMRRPDVRLAWREKVALVFLIMLMNAAVVFYIIFFGKLLCPNFDKAWSPTEVSYHQGADDFWVSHRGHVYDLSKFWRTQHGDDNRDTTQALMQPYGGSNVDAYINPPLTLACPGLVKDPLMQLTPNVSITDPTAIHTSGPALQPDTRTALNKIDWYTAVFLPKMMHFLKGDLVYDIKDIRTQGVPGYRNWFIIDNSVFDLTDYFNTVNNVRQGVAEYDFFPKSIESLIEANFGLDISQAFTTTGNSTERTNSLRCLNNYFYVGRTDFRKTPKCQVNNWLLLSFTIILCAVIVIKFLAALQLGSKRRPQAQDKFVIMQVPAYTEGEDQLRKGLDSLAATDYDNKRKLICVICDGVIVGKGELRPTPKIVLDILGVDPAIDPPALPFKSVGEGGEQLNYGKVFSGLYEHEGHVVPYIVVVKVGKDSEQGSRKPGNRGKRDSQILLMNFLNRVHHRSSMSPLELEMFHQINNIIGVDPELYEYLLMVDADTMVKEDSVTRLVASCAHDAKIAGICGETSLQNEEGSWWTMIQVYEYYISHHLAKAFESLFGSVTCLPGCFCMYRLRSADKGRPLLISNEVIVEYSDGEVDTLHKKNLLSLGEDRYLTTLMTKHFPNMSYKFVPDALAHTAAPDKWSILLSQRRRWINSTIHNLAELVFLKDMCGFCCFSMRFVVFIDLFGTIILPATCAYLGYLLYRVGTHSGQFPLVSLIMLAAVYGLQAVIFIVKRQWQHIGWMVIYIIAFPIYSFVLPIYSFWKQDDFSWGNTRMVVEEKGRNKVIAIDKHDEGFDPRSIPLQRWDDYAAANGLPGRRNLGYSEKVDGAGFDEMEMDELRSEYSFGRKPASTVYSGYQPQRASAVPPIGAQRNSMYSLGNRHSQVPSNLNIAHPRPGSSGNASNADGGLAPPRPISTVYNPSADNLNPSSANLRARHSMAFSTGPSRPVSTVNFMEAPKTGPTDEDITTAVREALVNVELDKVTKKQLMALAEMKLQSQLPVERRAFMNAVIDRELEMMDD